MTAGSSLQYYSTNTNLGASPQHSITQKEAYTLILKNKDNPRFVILDVRTPGEFASGRIENAVNLDYYSETFKMTLTSWIKIRPISFIAEPRAAAEKP